MRKEYARNKKIAIYGTAQTIAAAEAVLNRLAGLEGDIVGYRLDNEGDIRLVIQNAIDAYKIKASILVDGNTVYPYDKIVREYDRLRKSGKLEGMTDFFYKFLSLNFDIAHYCKNGYIGYYGNDFNTMKRTILDQATTPGWYTDVRRVLDYIQGLTVSAVPVQAALNF
jgi:hypothetical protein